MINETFPANFINMGGYFLFLHRVVDGQDDDNDFKFPPDFLLDPQRKVNVWSRSHAPTSLGVNGFVLKGDWSTDGVVMETIVVNIESEVVARHLGGSREE